MTQTFAPIVDSHCHLNMLDLSEFNGSLDEVIQKAKEHGVQHFLCVSVEEQDYLQLNLIAERYPEVSTSVGIHPNAELKKELDVHELVLLSSHPSCIAIGETGLDYFRTETEEAREIQRQRFRTHIQASRLTLKPLIIHTRLAAEDTLKIMAEENAEEIGGVMHCFSENWDIAKRALDLNFYLSFSGIVTFKNATQLQEVAKKAPLDRILIETDSPYLAPVPFRGRQNHPALVHYVAKMISELREESYETIAAATTQNFYQCFRVDKPTHP